VSNVPWHQEAAVLVCEGAVSDMMENLNWGYIQLGLVALGFGGLQVWWISSTLRKRELAKPLSEAAFRKTLEKIWAKGQGTP
jgi:hypothetical protein